MRRKDEVAIPEDQFFEELQCLARHKLVICQKFRDPEGKSVKEWKFRHDKIVEFFIVQTFLEDNNDRPLKHLNDPRFRGVYFLLAHLLPLKDAKQLREELIQYAAKTQDHTVSDAFILRLNSRQAIANPIGT